MVEASLRLFRVSHVPFADEGIFIAGFLQQLWKENQLVVDRVIVIDYPMIVSVEPREYRCSTWRTQRCGDECVFEVRPILRQTIDVRSLQKRVTGIAHGVES